MKCPTRFFIWFHHRSGSTHLTSLLDSHPDIACWKELFYRGEATATEDSFTLSRAESEDVFLEHLFSYRWGPGGANLCPADPQEPLPRAVGFKLKYQQAAAHPRIFEYLRGQKGVKVIHLIRANLLAALSSAAMIPRLLERFERPNVLAGESLDGIELSVRLDPRTILRELEALETTIALARQQLRGLSTLEITYEDLLNAPAATCRSALRFLGTDPSLRLTSRYVKIMPCSLHETLANADEIARVLAGSRFATMIDNG
jgi:hypothetical protein